MHPAAAGPSVGRVVDRAERQARERRAARRLTTDQGRSFVAEAGGSMVVYASALVREPWRYFSALFVDPTFQSRGIGRALFERCTAPWPARHVTIVDAHRPVSTGLYASKGLIPSTPLLVLGGTPRMSTPPDLEPGPTDAASLAALDQAAYGFDRALDHVFWAGTSEGVLWRRRGGILAYAYGKPGGWLGPLAGRDEAAAALALQAELARRTAVTVAIPGSCGALVEVAVRAGLRLVRPTGLLLHSRPVALPTALTVSGYWLC